MSHTGLRSGGLEYSASGLMGPGPMEAASADLMSAQADRVRAEARAMEAHPELFMGWRNGYYGQYGYSGIPRVDPNYYGYGQTRDPVLEERAEDLEEAADDYDRRLDALEGRQP